jgi:hypothetical protein
MERKLSLVLWKGGRGEGTVRMERKLSLVLWKGGRGEGTGKGEEAVTGPVEGRQG